ncbi:MAG: neutral zinc metallopeptidase [Propionibacteriaceae bacterium]|nr:neutral zinc metallopeptidase [Propionibacteriaceae bacterium]
MSDPTSSTSPPSPRRDGGFLRAGRDPGLLWWVVSGVAVFAVLATITIVVLLNNPTPAPSRPRLAPVQTATPTPSAPTATPLRPEDSALTTVRLDRTTCPEVRIRRSALTGAALERYLNSLIDCLVEVHQEPFREAGLILIRPQLSPATEVADSGCATVQEEPDDWAGLYCSANTTIYYRTDWAPPDPLHYVEVITHEFSHHLQHESDLLSRVNRAQRAAIKEPNGAARSQELSRRLELQADCLAATMVGPQGPLAVREGELQEFVAARAAVPPEWAATHGTGRAQSRWFLAGAQATGPARLAACDTFTAPAALVE